MNRLQSLFLHWTSECFGFRSGFWRIYLVQCFTMAAVESMIVPSISNSCIHLAFVAVSDQSYLRAHEKCGFLLAQRTKAFLRCLALYLLRKCVENSNEKSEKFRLYLQEANPASYIRIATKSEACPFIAVPLDAKIKILASLRKKL
jgi:hypothetical protein